MTTRFPKRLQIIVDQHNMGPSPLTKPAQLCGKRGVLKLKSMRCFEVPKTIQHHPNYAYYPPNKDTPSMPTKILHNVVHGGGYYSANTPKTQKVKGLSAIYYISEALYVNSNNNGDIGSNWFWARAQDLKDAPKPLVLNDVVMFMLQAGTLFMRPCPVVPRHGFVDSRVVKSLSEILKVVNETLAMDPDGEIIFCPFAEPKSSFVLTDGALTWGTGHDGATGGRSQTLFGPVLDEYTKNQIVKRANIAEGDNFFIEGVQDGGQDMMRLVQVRGGPPLAVATDYVPKAMVVKRVITCTPSTDLIEWERQIASAQPGDVVFAKGMGLASHFCVHAVVHSVSCMTTKQPNVGDKLAKTKTPEFKAADWKKLASYIPVADRFLAVNESSHDIRRKFAVLGLSALHCCGVPAPATGAQLRLLAFGAVSHAKLLAASCYGEMRHVESVGTSKDKRTNAVVKAFDHANNHNGGRDRETQYVRALITDLDIITDSMYCLTTSFRERAWEGSFGGEAWATIAAHTGAMLRALRVFQAKPNKENWAKVVSPWNTAINAEHNGGDGALNKHGISNEYFNKAAQSPVSYLTNAGAQLLNNVIFNDDVEEYVLRINSSTVIVTKKDLRRVKSDKNDKVVRRSGMLTPCKSYLGKDKWSVLNGQGNKLETLGTVALPLDVRVKFLEDKDMQYGCNSSQPATPAILNIREKAVLPKGGDKFVLSVGCAEAVLRVHDAGGFEPHSFNEETLVSVECPILGVTVRGEGGTDV